MRTLNIETRTHGRVLVRDAEDPLAVVVGFHGYTENADIQMERLVALAGTQPWTLVAPQGLHRFYRGRTPEVIASWMTRQDRELMIEDNIAYADHIADATAVPDVPLITIGFSQGVAMALRMAVRGRRKADGAIAVGGDVPPELLGDTGAEFPPTLILRGRDDDWYTAEKLEADLKRLQGRGVAVRATTYDAAHVWNDSVTQAASAFIEELIASRPRPHRSPRRTPAAAPSFPPEP